MCDYCDKVELGKHMLASEVLNKQIDEDLRSFYGTDDIMNMDWPSKETQQRLYEEKPDHPFTQMENARRILKIGNHRPLKLSDIERYGRWHRAKIRLETQILLDTHIPLRELAKLDPKIKTVLHQESFNNQWKKLQSDLKELRKKLESEMY